MVKNLVRQYLYLFQFPDYCTQCLYRQSLGFTFYFFSKFLPGAILGAGEVKTLGWHFLYLFQVPDFCTRYLYRQTLHIKFHFFFIFSMGHSRGGKRLKSWGDTFYISINSKRLIFILNIVCLQSVKKIRPMFWGGGFSCGRVKGEGLDPTPTHFFGDCDIFFKFFLRTLKFFLEFENLKKNCL